MQMLKPKGTKRMSIFLTILAAILFSCISFGEDGYTCYTDRDGSRYCHISD
jgi:hypothetical protein